MATNNPTATLDQARVATLAQAVRGVIEPFLNARSTNTEARDMAADASKAETNARETILTSLADFSQTQQLTSNEITAVAAKVIVGQNDLDSQKAVAQFIGECKRAMNPNVRAHVREIIGKRDMCWDSETERKVADKDEVTPLRDTFKRRYHMMLAMFDAFGEGVTFETAEDVLRWGDEVAEKQRLDTKRVLKTLEAITKQLVAFHKDFPVEDIGVCIEALQGIDAKILKASRPGTNVVNLPVRETTRKTVEVKQAEPIATTTVVAESVEGEPGASEAQGDILNEMLGETDVSHLAA